MKRAINRRVYLMTTQEPKAMNNSHNIRKKRCSWQTSALRLGAGCLGIETLSEEQNK